jgi:hypothetical protein
METMVAGTFYSQRGMGGDPNRLTGDMRNFPAGTPICIECTIHQTRQTPRGPVQDDRYIVATPDPDDAGKTWYAHLHESGIVR